MKTEEKSLTTIIETTNNLQIQVDDDIINKDPFDPRFYITDSNKSDMIKYFEKEIRDSFE